VDWILAASGTRETETTAPAVQAGTTPNPAAHAAVLTQRLLEVVSERTGYPVEMLGVDLDLEADLGIDSIKRIEILGEYRHRHGAGDKALGEEAMEKLTTIRTLRGIVDWILAASAPTTTQTIPPAPAARAGETITVPPPAPIDAAVVHPVRRHVLVASEIGKVERPGAARVGGAIVVTDDGGGVAREVVSRLRERDQAAALVQHAEAARAVSPGCYQADLSSPESIAALVELMRRDQGRIAGLLHLAPLAPFDESSASPDAIWRDRVGRDVKGLLNLARELHDDLREAGRSGAACLLTATGMGGAFGTTAAGFFPGDGGLTGLAKTLAREWPEVPVRALDVEPSGGASEIAASVLAEMTAGSEAVEVGHQNSRRLTLRPAPAPLESDRAPALAIDESWVILVTGGARGVTGEVVLDLARRYRPTLVLVGRSPAPSHELPDTAGIAETRALKAALLARASVDGQLASLATVEQAHRRLLQDREIHATLAGVARAGARVEYVSLDVRDEAALAGLVRQVYERYGRLDGVIHGAGVIEDKLVKDKSPASFDRVFETKVSGARALVHAARPESLRFLVFFGSVAGAFGNRGQGDYAAANDVLNKMALALDRAWPGRVVSINWGPWSTGMVSAELERQFASRGIAPISVAAGCQAMDAELRYGRKGEAVVLLTAGEREAPGEGPPAAQRRGTPMLGRDAGVTNGGSGLHLVRTLDPARDLYLQDHRLGGKAVLPMAVGCELIAETALLAVPGLDLVGVRDLRVLRGIVLDNGPRPVRVAATRLTAAAERTEVEVVITEAENPSRLHYRAVVELAPRLPEPPPDGWPAGEPVRPFPLDIEEAYRRWLFHGPRLRAVRAIRGLSPEGIHGVIAPSSPGDLLDSAAGDAWLIDPVIVDGGLQLILLWLRAHRDLAALPAGFRRYRRFDGPVGTLMDCRARIWIDSMSLTMHADLVFMGEGGKVVGALEDVQGTCSKSVVQMFER
jgi:NAD(P)-dependent dehydrogenase (short-subunit alcohol dehydrogenase family)